MPFATRPWLRVAAVIAAIAGVYALGAVSGAASSGGLRVTATVAPPDSYGVLDEAARRIAAQAARPVDPELLTRAAVEGMLSALGDRWSRYLGPADYASFSEALDGRYSGVGLWLAERRGAVVVSGVQDPSPARASGLLAGDILIAVDGSDVTREPLGEVADRLRGESGSPVSITVSRDGSPVRLTVVRSEVSGSDVTVERLVGGIQVVRVEGFTRGVGREVRQALASDTGGRANGVVLDLRGNPGGLLAEAVDVAGAFLDGGPVVSYETRSRGTRTLEALGRGDTATPVVVLVDGATASAAEVVAAALQDRSRAVVVGTRTYGKGSVQESSPLSDGSALELTVGRYRTPSGRSIDGVGVEPDIVAEGGSSAAEQRALEVLRGLVAASGGPG